MSNDQNITTPPVSSFRPLRFGHIGLVARDLDRMVDFYCNVLGMTVADRVTMDESLPLSRAVWLRLNTDHHVISMFEMREDPGPREEPRAPRPGLHHFAFQMHTFAELQAVARFVREQGIPVHAMRAGGPGCQIRLYIWDPEDNQIELYWGLDQIGWDGRSRPFPDAHTVDIENFDLDSWLEFKGAEFERPDPR